MCLTLGIVACSCNHKAGPVCYSYVVNILGQLRECRDYRDKMIGDRVQHMMSSSAQKFIPCHTLSYEDAGYKSDESHYSSKKLHAASDGKTAPPNNLLLSCESLKLSLYVKLLM